MSLAVFWKYLLNFDLLTPVEIRFASKFIMIERLLKARGALEQKVVDLQWTEYVSTLVDVHTKKSKPKTISLELKENVQLNYFWNCCVNFVDLVEPVMCGLVRDLDSKGEFQGRVQFVSLL
jgi:hypothetical protein